jgi:uncharacterized protein
MDKNEAIKIATRYTSKISRKFPIEGALIFGSFAKGTNHTDSDIDLAIFFKSISDLFDLQIELLCLRSDDDLLIEPPPFLTEDLNTPGPLLTEILKYGIEIKNFAA